MALTIAVYSDARVLLSTHVKLMRVDNYSESFLVDLIRDLLDQEILATTPLPYTEAQLQSMLIGFEVVQPG
jgi:hypothetical protein